MLLQSSCIPAIHGGQMCESGHCTGMCRCREAHGCARAALAASIPERKTKRRIRGQARSYKNPPKPRVVETALAVLPVGAAIAQGCAGAAKHMARIVPYNPFAFPPSLEVRCDRGREGLTPSPPSEPCVRFSRTRLSSRSFPHRDRLADSQASVKVKSPASAKKVLGQRRWSA